VVLVSPNLIEQHLKNRLVAQVFQLLESDIEVQTLLRMANVMAVTRLHYNDHGPVHSRITAGSALEIFEILREKVQPSIVRDGVGNEDDSRVVVLCGAYLHDIGNSVHRTYHNIHSYVLANPILERLLPKVYENRQHLYRVKQEILHSLYSHDEQVQCLTMEAGVAKIADGTDMAEGRARIPYLTGKIDIHSLSALAIKKLEILREALRPVKIVVDMTNPAGVFQIEQTLEKKITTSGLQDLVEVTALQDGKELKIFRY
jgi:metal-dependent HD superfamily phosphatase/phosphodiesterase